MPGFALVLDSVPKCDGEKKVIEIKLGFLDSVGCGSSIDRALDSCWGGPAVAARSLLVGSVSV